MSYIFFNENILKPVNELVCNVSLDNLISGCEFLGVPIAEEKTEELSSVYIRGNRIRHCEYGSKTTI